MVPDYMGALRWNRTGSNFWRPSMLQLFAKASGTINTVKRKWVCLICGSQGQQKKTVAKEEI